MSYCIRTGVLEWEDTKELVNARENWRSIENIAKWWSVLYGHSLIDLEPSYLVLSPFNSPERFRETRSTCIADYQTITAGLRKAGKEIYRTTWESVRDDNRKKYQHAALFTGRTLKDSAWCRATMTIASGEVMVNPTHFRIDPNSEQGIENMFRTSEHLVEQEAFWLQQFNRYPPEDEKLVQARQGIADEAQARFDSNYAVFNRDDFPLNNKLAVISTFFEQEISSCSAKRKEYQALRPPQKN